MKKDANARMVKYIELPNTMSQKLIELLKFIQ